MELTVNPAPALSRGLTLLRQLDRGGPDSLESLAHSTGWPKSSVLRILQSLELVGAVRRDPVTRQYHPKMRLVPVAAEGRTLPEQAGPMMDDLCRQTGVTVELYAWRDAGLTMIDRREPAEAEVCVRARVGHVRDLSEIEALSQVVRVWPPEEPPEEAAVEGTLPLRNLWAWDAGQRRRVSARQLQSVLRQTRERQLGLDLNINENGVRRYARPLFRSSTPAPNCAAVLALAQVCPPSAVEPDPALIAALHRAVERFTLD